MNTQESELTHMHSRAGWQKNVSDRSVSQIIGNEHIRVLLDHERCSLTVGNLRIDKLCNFV
jgi:hypothetical protein